MSLYEEGGGWFNHKDLIFEQHLEQIKTKIGQWNIILHIFIYDVKMLLYCYTYYELENTPWLDEEKI